MLDDIRVIELSRTAAGAFAGRLFADDGAEVILVEPLKGHPLRREGPFLNDEPDTETSTAHLHANAGKRSVTLDIDSQPDALLALLRTAQAFLTDLDNAMLNPLGLDWRSLNATLPGLLMTQVTYFGQTGPYRGYAGSNLISLALGGSLKTTGDPGRAPLSNFGSQAEFQAGLAAFAGTLANLLLTDETGQGEYLDLSVQDVVAQNLEGRSLTFNLDVMLERAGLNVSAVYGVYPCADGWVFLSAFAPALWEQLKSAAQLPELDEDRFSSQAGRLQHNDDLQAILTGWTLSKTADELRLFAQKGYPLTVAETPERLLRSEQWSGRHFARTVDHPVSGRIAALGPPWFEAAPAPPRPAPLLGEANSDLLTSPAQAKR